MNNAEITHHWTWKHALAACVFSGLILCLLPGINAILALVFTVAGLIMIWRRVTGNKRILAEFMFVCGATMIILLALLVIIGIFGMGSEETIILYQSGEDSQLIDTIYTNVGEEFEISMPVHGNAWYAGYDEEMLVLVENGIGLITGEPSFRGSSYIPILGFEGNQTFRYLALKEGRTLISFNMNHSVLDSVILLPRMYEVVVE